MTRTGPLMLAHTDLVVSAMDASLAFYAGALGLRIVEDTVVRGDIVSYVSRGAATSMRLVLLAVSPVGATIELCELSPGGSVAPHAGSISLLVGNLDVEIGRLRRAGLTPDSDVFRLDLPKAGRSLAVFYRDPDGHPVELIQALSEPT